MVALHWWPFQRSCLPWEWSQSHRNQLTWRRGLWGTRWKCSGRNTLKLIVNCAVDQRNKSPLYYSSGIEWNMLRISSYLEFLSIEQNIRLQARKRSFIDRLHGSIIEHSPLFQSIPSQFKRKKSYWVVSFCGDDVMTVFAISFVLDSSEKLVFCWNFFFVIALVKPKRKNGEFPFKLKANGLFYCFISNSKGNVMFFSIFCFSGLKTNLLIWRMRTFGSLAMRVCLRAVVFLFLQKEQENLTDSDAK